MQKPKGGTRYFCYQSLISFKFKSACFVKLGQKTFLNLSITCINTGCFNYTCILIMLFVFVIPCKVVRILTISTTRLVKFFYLSIVVIIFCNCYIQFYLFSCESNIMIVRANITIILMLKSLASALDSSLLNLTNVWSSSRTHNMFCMCISTLS